jgi:predicted house-cleaning noncanonical NTP pyrophosphatase (MazG superfamily)
MSGGHFDYVQHRLDRVVDQIQELIDNNNVEDELGYASDYSKETLDKFREAVEIITKASNMIHRIDYLVSGDDGEDTFNKKWSGEKGSHNET